MVSLTNSIVLLNINKFRFLMPATHCNKVVTSTFTAVSQHLYHCHW